MILRKTYQDVKDLSAGYWILASILLVKLISNYILIHPVYELHRDEFLHLDQANHLSWGYLSVPPLTSWISLLIRIPGNSEFWIKFFPALFGALTIYGGWKIAEILNAGLFGKTLTALALLFSVILRINILYQPNSFDILAWTLVFLFFIRYIKTENPKWLYFTAICFALGLLNKYSILFLGISMVAGIILTKHRVLFVKKHSWYAAAVALLIVSPNLLWQVKNGFPFIEHMKELAETQLVNVNRIDFLKEQVLFFINSILILISAFTGLAAYQPFRKYRMILFTYIICILLFVYFRAKGYYAIGLYPVLIAFGSVYLERFTRAKHWIFKPALAALIILLFLPMLIAFPVMKPAFISRNAEVYKSMGLLRWEDGEDHHLPQDFADMLGWKEMAAKTDSVLKTLPQSEYTIIRTDNYGQAGAINHYAGLNAVSYNADYLDWFDFSRNIENMVLVKEKEDSDPLRNDEKPYFDSVYLAAEITNPDAREYGTKIYVLKKAKQPINTILQKEIDDIKNH